MTALAVYVLAFKRGSTSGYRLILVGHRDQLPLWISITDLPAGLALRIEEAQEATRWLLGSLNGRDLGSTHPHWRSRSRCCCSLAIPARPRAARARTGRRPVARARPERGAFRGWRWIGLAVGLVVGRRRWPSARSCFVALTAPQIARRLMRTAGLPLVCSALTGAALDAGRRHHRPAGAARPRAARGGDDGRVRRALSGLAADVGVAQGPLADHLLRRLARDGLGQLGREPLADVLERSSGVMKYIAPLSVASV